MDIADTRGARRALAACVGLLGVSNVVSNRVLGPAGYVPWNLAVTGLLVGLARRSGVQADDVGLGRAEVRRGAGVGGASAAAVVAVMLALSAHDRTRHSFDDDRAGGAGRWILAWTLLGRIPLGTVVLEEVAFRGVLPALMRRAGGPAWVAVAAPSTLFGAWHVVPSMELWRSNAAVAASLPRTLGATVAATALAGAGLQGVGAAGRHLLAPALVHAAANVTGFVVAWGRLRGRRQ